MNMNQNRVFGMFYLDTIEQRLRFGDVLEGYLSTIPKIDEPFIEENNQPYQIDVTLPDFCVVMDPCCNIGGGSLSLTPLIKVWPHWWDNPYLAKDMTIINREMNPKHVMHPLQWNDLSLEEKLEMITAEPQHNRLNFFVYEENKLFPSYDIEREYRYEEKVDVANNTPIFEQIKEDIELQTTYYMIDFKNIYHVKCKKISKPDKELDTKVSKSKILQLSIKTRNELRDKMAFYFGNPPDEDREDIS